MSILKTSLGAMAAAALVLSAAAPASAASNSPHAKVVKAGTSDMTDFSARRRGGGNGGAAAAAAFAGIVGTAIAVGAANSYYNDGYGYGGGYAGSPYDSYNYYGGGPGYYGSPRAYSRYGSSPNSVEGAGGYNNPTRW